MKLSFLFHLVTSLTTFPSFLLDLTSSSYFFNWSIGTGESFVSYLGASTTRFVFSEDDSDDLLSMALVHCLAMLL